MLIGTTVFRCGDHEHAIEIGYRDVQLLDGGYFLEGESSGQYRRLFGLDFLRGLGAPPLGKVLQTFPRHFLLNSLRALLQALEDHRDLLAYNYQFSFSAEPKIRGSAGLYGFRVDGFIGQIDARPPGYCDLTLWEVAPNGKGRIVGIIDMRVKKEIMTEDRGLLRIHRRSAPVGWFDTLPPLIAWVDQQHGQQVDVLHR